MLPVGALCFYQAHFGRKGASEMAILGSSLLLCILQCFGASEGMLPPGACRSSRASAKCIVSCRGLCVSSLCSQIPLAPAPTFGAFRFLLVCKIRSYSARSDPKIKSARISGSEHFKGVSVIEI